ncbi:MAG TPA: hypothetical protein VGN74_08150 [Brevundimonas sp.]|jgi:hypothetical protein|uniref:hypothetical protein n=1 Tax=Brevundimonas sp. TaxID=1871086 RepID=UPI002E0D1450|nr:hypothetical protein [Brevundimonas sp.]
METAVLTEEIKAFDDMLPRLRQEYGGVWAVLVGQDFKGAFQEFRQAAAFAVANFADTPFLIRHTEQHTAQIPFVAIDP